MSDIDRHLRIFTENILALIGDPRCYERMTNEEVEDVVRVRLQAMYSLGRAEALARPQTLYVLKLSPYTYFKRKNGPSMDAGHATPLDPESEEARTLLHKYPGSCLVKIKVLVEPQSV